MTHAEISLLRTLKARMIELANSANAQAKEIGDTPELSNLVIYWHGQRDGYGLAAMLIQNALDGQKVHP